jgi:hypothetical protein
MIVSYGNGTYGNASAHDAIDPTVLDALALGCIVLVIVFSVNKRNRISNRDFLYLLLIMVFVLLIITILRDTLCGYETKRKEAFRDQTESKPSDENNNNNERENKKKDHRDLDGRRVGGVGELYELPGRVSGVISPKIQRLANAFKQTTTDDEGDEDEQIDVDEENVYIRTEEFENGEVRVDKWDSIRRAYKYLTYILCQLQQGDKGVYEDVKNNAGEWLERFEFDLTRKMRSRGGRR